MVFGIILMLIIIVVVVALTYFVLQSSRRYVIEIIAAVNRVEALVKHDEELREAMLACIKAITQKN